MRGSSTTSTFAAKLITLGLVIAVAAIAGCGGTAPKAASCAGSHALPQRYVSPGPVSTHLQFVQNGCNVAIASIELYSGTHLVRSAVFNPPLPAGSLTAKDAATFAGKGSFRATSHVAGSAGAVSLTQQGTYTATGAVVLTRPVGGLSRQFAAAATASTSLSDKWSAIQATGAPARKAWAPGAKDGTSEWLDLTYAQTVIPTGIDIWENNGPGFVTKVEAFNPAKSAWVKLWEGTDPTQGAPKLFSPPLSKTNVSTNRVRLTVNTNVPGWNEVAAVALVGAPQPSGQVIWLQGDWVESGKQTSCVDKTCTTAPLVNSPIRGWAFAFNTVTGRVGTTPDEVS